VQRTFTSMPSIIFGLGTVLTKVISTVPRTPTRQPVLKQKWRRRKVPRWLVRCAPHQAIGSLIPPDVCFGVGCPPGDLISSGLSSPCYGGPRVRISLPPPASLSQPWFPGL
jgi:hypothetical protein